MVFNLNLCTIQFKLKIFSHNRSYDDTERVVKTDKKSTKLEKKAPRRGIWRRKQIRPIDGFETAETQNIGKHLYNSITDNEKKNDEKHKLTEETSTIFLPRFIESETTTVSSDTLVSLPEQTVIEDSKTRTFDDARKAFVEFLSTEENDGVNMEEVDDKTEIENTTTTEFPVATSTEEPPTTTTISQITTEESTIKPKGTKEKKEVKTSTSQKVTGEICFRGKCIKTNE